VTPPRQPPKGRVAGFRTRLLVAIMLVVSGVTLVALFVGQRSLVATVEEELEREFDGQLAALRQAQEIRHAALVERCRALVRKQRIRAAFEDDALDLLYPNAEDELRDVMGAGEASALRGEFYRFLDPKGGVIPPANPRAVGALRPEEEAKLALPGLPARPQDGFLVRRDGRDGEMLSEVIVMPIVSSETGEPIAALALGFRPYHFTGNGDGTGLKSGIWVEGSLYATGLPAAANAALRDVVRPVLAGGPAARRPARTVIDGVPQLVFARALNSGSVFPPAYEVCVYPLGGLAARQRDLRWRVLGAGALLLLLGFAGSHLVSARLSRPVERLAVESEEDRAQRARAEAALELTSAELQRSARFSADASHQLKTPVTVLRAGLEELLAQEHLTADQCHEISALIHQTYRLSSLIEDLLMLSRMDAGRLKLQFGPVNLSQLIDASLDDLSALPDETDVALETDFPSDVQVAGEKRYTAIILQNLLENARKYNERGGRIRIHVATDDGWARVLIGNTGPVIAPAAQAFIFERFHRGAMGENVPGYGLGLNLARELARLHHGELRLVRSEQGWTEFELRLRLAQGGAASATGT
jgi:signal transduction histidine kinase